MNSNTRTNLGRYTERFGYCPPRLEEPPAAGLGLMVVIPCHAEPELVDSLEALWQCDRPSCPVEVLVVVNASEDAAQGVQALNRQTLAQARAWAAGHSEPGWTLHLLEFDRLPSKHAGVGLARKIGMDEALHRLNRAGMLEQGVIVGFDADCGCERTLLARIAAHFEVHLESPGCSIHFEHPLAGPLDQRVYEAGMLYELHLRYFIQGLRWAGYPFAYQTIGSSMAVRATAYMEQGGMNKRQAGEDFYFLHKIIPLGGFADLTETTVYPSPRASDRVPFGTGRAVRAQVEGRPLQTYPLEAFQDLAGWFALDFPVEQWKSAAPDSLRTFLESHQFDRVWSEIQANTKPGETRYRRWLRWFDGFRAMKFIHHARDRFYGARPVESEAARLLSEYRCAEPKELLESYRELARRQVWQSAFSIGPSSKAVQQATSSRWRCLRGRSIEKPD